MTVLGDLRARQGVSVLYLSCVRVVGLAGRHVGGVVGVWSGGQRRRVGRHLSLRSIGLGVVVVAVAVVIHVVLFNFGFRRGLRIGSKRLRHASRWRIWEWDKDQWIAIGSSARGGGGGHKRKKLERLIWG